MFILKTILGFLGGGVLDSIGKQLNEAYRTKVTAQNNEQRIAADVTISRLEAQQAVLVAEQANWMTRLIRPLFALPFIIYNMKVVLWDKVLGLGTTDALSPDFVQLQMIVFGAYFLARPFEKWARK